MAPQIEKPGLFGSANSVPLAHIRTSEGMLGLSSEYSRTHKRLIY